MTTARHLSELLDVHSHGERIAIAVQDLVLADDTLTAWASDRVYRVPDARLWPDKVRPMITVGPDLAESPLRLQGEATVALSLLITLFYDEPRTILDPDDKGPESLLHHVWWLLVSSPESRALQVDRFGQRPLVQEPPSTADLRFADAFTGDTHADGSPVVERYPQLQLTYRYILERHTGQPPGFP